MWGAVGPILLFSQNLVSGEHLSIHIRPLFVVIHGRPAILGIDPLSLCYKCWLYPSEIGLCSELNPSTGFTVQCPHSILWRQKAILSYEWGIVEQNLFRYTNLFDQLQPLFYLARCYMELAFKSLLYVSFIIRLLAGQHPWMKP